MSTITTPTRHHPTDRPGIPSAFEVFEETAFDLAREAGALILASLEGDIEVSYKDGAQGLMAPRDPVSTVDVAVEHLLRRRLAARHPDHAVLGEESGLSGPEDAEYLWLVDPIDGTANFVNGVPLFASTLALLRRGVPVAGATWCVSTHAFRPGVYHAHLGGELGFDGAPLRASPRMQGVQRTLSTAPMRAEPHAARWDHRRIGSAATEAAYVSAGLLASARLGEQRSWDVAAGVVLAQSAGHEVWTRHEGRWQPFESFGADPAGWSQAALFGTSAALTALRPSL